MKISLNWLKDFVEFDKKLSIPDIMWKLTEATAEIEQAIDLGAALEKIVVGKITDLKKHPDADKLRIAMTDVGTETLQIVCGGSNLAVGMTVAVSLPGAMVRWHGEGDPVEVKKVKLRGVESIGMICASEEIGLEKMFSAESETEILDLSYIDALPGTPVAELLGLDDIVFDIDNHSITHRNDLFSHYGFARECVALGLAKWKNEFKEKDPAELTGKKKMPVSPNFADKSCSKNYYSTVISNLSTKESPAWVKARLHAVGIRSINAIVDITNLSMMETGQPCHAFDLRLIADKKFEHRLSKKDEELTTLDGEKRKLDADVIIIQSGDDIVDLCGIMGAENSAIKDDSTEIYLHCCHYDNVLIRKAMISLGHRTDAGTIFEKNIEPERAKIGFQRNLELFAEIFPEAKFEHEVFHQQNEESDKVEITLPLEKFTSHVGIEVDAKKSQKILEDLGFKVSVSKNIIKAISPSWRSNDVTIPEDLIEEIARINGYSNVPAQVPSLELATPHRNHKRVVKRTIQRYFTGQGFLNEANYSFLSEALLNKVGITDFSNLIELANPVSEDFKFMRPNFLAYLLSNLSRNQILEAREWKSFEMGAVYKRLEQEVVETHILTTLVSSTANDSKFFEVKGLVSSLLDELSIPHEFDEADHDHAYPGRSVAVIAEGNVLGHVFELHPALVESFKLKGNIAVFECNLDDLYQVTSEEVFYSKINRNPAALLDISVVVDQKVAMSDVEKTICSIESDYLRKTQLIDIYQGENLGQGKKSFTFALSYQHPERTLEEKEIQDILDKVIKALEKDGGVVRR